MPLDKVDIIVAGNVLKKVTSYDLHYDIFHGAASFSANVNHDDLYVVSASPIPFEIQINGISWMKGLLDKVQRRYSKGEFDQIISGRDMCQLLIDNDILYPTIYASSQAGTVDQNLYGELYVTPKIGSWPIDKVIQDIWKTNSIVRSITNPISSPVKLNPPISLMPLDFAFSDSAKKNISTVGDLFKIRTSYGQKLWDSIGKLANMAGCIVYNIPGTKTILLHSASSFGSDRPQSFKPDGTSATDAPWQIVNLKNGIQNNVLSCDFETDITDYYSYVKLVGQSESETFNQLEEIAKSQFKADNLISGYTGLNKFGCHEIDVVDSTMWQNAYKNLLENVILQMNRKLYSLKYTVAGHAPTPGGIPWYVNHLVQVSDDYLPMYNATMLVYRVDMSGSKDGGTKTEIELCQPSALNLWIAQLQMYLKTIISGGVYRGFKSLSNEQADFIRSNSI